MKPRYVVVVILGAMLILDGVGCRREVPPDRPDGPRGPDYTWTGIPTTYTVSAHIDRGTIRFVTDWGDMVDTTAASYASGETAAITHVWTSPGLMPVKVQAINSAAPEKASDWSNAESVDVILDSVPGVPIAPCGSDSAWAGLPASFKTAATIVRGTVRFVTDWGDMVDTTAASYASGETAAITHVWTSLGLMPVRVQAINSAAPERASDWSKTKSVTVMTDSLPVIDSFVSLPVAVPGVEYVFRTEAHDPDGDSIRLHINWGDGADTTTEFVHSPYYLGFRPAHTYAQVGTATVVITAQDWKGARSLPETALVRVDTTGGVIWDANEPVTTPLVVNDGVEDLVYYGWLTVRISILGARPADGSLRYLTMYPSATVGAAYCAASNHIIVVSSGLWAQDGCLDDVWQCETTKSTGWRCPAISGDRIYVGNDNHTLYCFIDSIDRGVRAGSLATQGAVVDAPVVDAQGDVCFGTDSGFLYRVGPGLDTILWCRRLVTNGEVHSPIIGRDGTIYCAAGSQSIYAIDPATGTPLWTVVLDGQPLRLAAGQAAVFVGTTAGKAYSLAPATGGINWAKVLSQPDGLSAAPAVAADGSVYFQSDDDVLYRLNQADGTAIWECDCASYRGKIRYHVDSRLPSRMSPAEYRQNPTILPNGDVIVAGVNALYCVAGSHAGPLDPVSPWPKWQHDLYNTGCVGGGR